MSNKGKVFTIADLPQITRQRLKDGRVSEEEKRQLEGWIAAQTERNRIVAMDGDTPIIAEELVERALRKHSQMGADPSQLLIQLRNLVQLTPAQRVWVLDSFDENGELVIPFETVEQPKPAKPKKK
jgi:hypothetical protein